MQAAGIDPVAHEKERIEKIKRDRFKPYIFAQGERTVPTQITMFGISGGHRRWHTVLIPAAILELPIEEQLARVPELMAKYSQENNGACPFFGRIVGFKFVCYGDYFQFDADGQLLKHVVTQKPFEFGEAWVELR